MPHIGVFHRASDKSDHVPIEVTTITRSGKSRKRNKIFRFEDMWLTSPECEDVVRETWTRSGGVWEENGVLGKIRMCSHALQRWSTSEFGNITKKIKQAREKMAKLDGSAPNADMVRERKATCEEIDNLLHLEETTWRQRSRVDNLREGDQNTKYFHMKATGRRRRNMIRGIRSDTGEWVIDHDEITSTAVEYFTQLFTSATSGSSETVLDSLDGRVTESMNSMLRKDFTQEEVRTAMFQMSPSKAPGPDGMNANFFQKHWHIIG